MVTCWRIIRDFIFGYTDPPIVASNLPLSRRLRKSVIEREIYYGPQDAYLDLACADKLEELQDEVSYLRMQMALMLSTKGANNE
jgi:hypothetical protein